MPFLAIRTVYSILVVFENDASFGILKGDAYVQLGFAVVEEMCLSLFYISLSGCISQQR